MDEINNWKYTANAGQTQGTVMQQQVCDINSHETHFFVDNGVAYRSADDKPQFWIRDRYWIPYLSDDKWPLYVQDGKYVYAYPREDGPVFYYRQS